MNGTERRTANTAGTAKAGKGPLSGVRVLEIGMLFAGPMVGTNMSDLGADVIKVEHPSGDEVRKIGRFKNGEGLWWRVTSRNKTLISVDIKKPEGAAIVVKLAKDADVFVENFRPGRAAEWGMDYKTLSAENPGLVMLHISGYGQDGPYRDHPGMGTLAEGFSGFAEVNGEPQGPPTLPHYPLADGIAALVGTYSVLAALYARERNDGVGEEIELSLYESMLGVMGPMILDYDQLGHVARRKGNRSTWSVPRNSYKTKDDRWVAVAAAANSVAMRLFRAIDRPDMAEDPTLATNPLRVKRLEECDGIIANWIAQHTLDEVLERFRKFEVVAGPIYDVEQLVNDPHVRARGTVIEVDDPALGMIKMQDVVPRFKRNPGEIRWPGRRDIGSDTSSVLAGLGYTEADVAALQDRGIIKTAS